MTNMIQIKALLAKITAKLVTQDSSISTVQGDISTLQTDMTGAQGDITSINNLLGSSTMTTTAQTVTGAVNELDSDISGLPIPWSQAQGGSEAFSSVSAGGTTTIAVTFSPAFTGEPRIVLGMKGGSAAGATQLQVGYHNASGSGFTIDVRNRGTSGYNGRVSWFAFL